MDLVEELRRRESVRNRVIDNAPAAVTLILFSFMILKINLIADGDASTTLALLGRASLVQVVIGSILASAPLLTAGITAAMIHVRSQDHLLSWEKGWLYANLATVLLWLSYIVAWSSLLGVATVLVVFFAVPSVWGKWRKKPDKRKENTVTWEHLYANPSDDVEQRALIRQHQDLSQARSEAERTGDHIQLAAIATQTARVQGRYSERVREIAKASRSPLEAAAMGVIAAALVPIVIHLVNNDRPWMPAEVIYGQSNDRWVGYVLSHDERALVLLRDKDRAVISIDGKQIRARIICTPRRASLTPVRTIWRVGADLKPRYERCPDLPAPAVKVPATLPVPTGSASSAPSQPPSGSPSFPASTTPSASNTGTR